MDLRDSSPDTTVVLPATPVDGKRSAERRWKDNAILRMAPPASSQPAPGTKGERRSVSDTGSARSQKSDDWQKRTSRLTLRVRPGVKSALLRLAKDDKVSLSEASATGLEIYARASIHDQEETLFEPRMQAMMRREIRTSDKRHLYFEMCNAMASEQTRVYTADLYKRVLRKEGMSQKEINKKLDDAYTMARNNILRKAKTPQLKNLFDAWWQSTENMTESTGEAGTGKPES